MYICIHRHRDAFKLGNGIDFFIGSSWVFFSVLWLFRWINKDSADFGKQVACFFYAQVFLFFEMSPVLIVQCTVQVFFTNIDCILSIKIFDFAHTKHSFNNLQFDCSASIFICKRLQSRQWKLCTEKYQ